MNTFSLCLSSTLYCGLWSGWHCCHGYSTALSNSGATWKVEQVFVPKELHALFKAALRLVSPFERTCATSKHSWAVFCTNLHPNAIIYTDIYSYLQKMTFQREMTVVIMTRSVLVLRCIWSHIMGLKMGQKWYMLFDIRWDFNWFLTRKAFGR